MQLSIIIVNYNAAEFIGRCLASLESNLTGVEHEVCVIDNASTDASRDIVRSRFPQVRLITNKTNLGFGAAINVGLDNTSGSYVMWLNPDSELLNEGVSEVLRYFERNPDVGVVGSRIVNPDGSVQLSCRSFPSYKTALFNRYSLMTRLFPNNRHSADYLQTGIGHDGIRQVDWVSGACLLHRREVTSQIGRLDERFFMYCEDVDFCLRSTKGGWRVAYHPSMEVLHHIGGSSRQLKGRCIRERHRSMWLYYAKHFVRNPLKDSVVGAAIWGRCSFLLAREWFRPDYGQIQPQKKVLSDRT